MNIEQYVRRCANCSAKKYSLVIMDDGNAPRAFHADGVTHWKGGRPRSYDRATNELQVGNEWLAATLPATWAAHRLAGNRRFVGAMPVCEGDLQAERDAIDLAMRAQRTAEQAARTALLWSNLQTRKADERSFDPENERLYA